MQVAQVNQSTPVPRYGRQFVTIALALTNNTDLPIRRLTISAARGTAIMQQQSLNASLDDDRPATGTFSVPAVHPVIVNLAPDEIDHRVSYRITTGLAYTNSLCLCADAVYPIDLSAQLTSAGSVKTVATAHTYIPSFKDQKHAPVQVSWVWPLIDRPHRIGDGSAFIDDDLTAEVAANGRLDRALRVVEQVGPTVPIMLVVDPELLDELEIMSTGTYTVRSGPTTTVPGVGQTAAAEWLSRFQQVLTDPGVTVDLIPYADPDIQTLTSHGLGWSSTMPPSMAARVLNALGNASVESDVSWPAGGAIDQNALDAITAAGAKTVIVDRASVAPKEVDSVPASLARLHSTNGTITAALTSPAIQAYVRTIVTRGGAGDAALPQLVSELAIRTDTSILMKHPYAGHVVVLTAPRYVDASPRAAVRAILQTTTESPFSEGISLDAATTGKLVPRSASHLRGIPADADLLPDEIVNQTEYVSSSVRPIAALLRRSRPARSIVAALPWQLQQSESAGWRSDADAIGGPTIGKSLASRLRRQVEGLLGSVSILKPSSSGSYTLASNKASLPLTVQNTGPYVLRVHIEVRAVNGLPGFRTYSGTKLVLPDRKQTVHIPTEVDRSGRIAISAQLSTPTARGVSGVNLGPAISLNVHSTALGTIGIVITVVAGVVLLLALLIRYVRRIKRIRTKRRKNAETARAKSATAQREPAS